MGKIAVKDELSILMELLDEQDEQSLKKISDCIVAYGNAAIPYLEATSEITLDSVVQSRIKKIIYKIIFQNLFYELHNWATLNSKDLLKGYFLISKYFYPDLEEERIMAQVDALKKEVWLELKQNMTPYEGAKVLSKVFFEVKNFSLNEDPVYFTDSLCLNTLLDSGMGYPTAFSVLYAGIAQRLGLPLYGVNMPESMFLAYVSTKNKQTDDLKNNVIFYLNPLAVGAFFTDLSIKEHLEKAHPMKTEEYIGACSNTKFILHVLDAMQYSLICSSKIDTVEKVLELNMLKKALETF